MTTSDYAMYGVVWVVVLANCGAALLSGTKTTCIKTHQGEEHTRYTWSEWGGWSSCTRSPGAQVQYQRRPCCHNSEEVGQDLCGNISRRYKLCRLESPDSWSVDLRAHLCARLNHVPFRNSFHRWVPVQTSSQVQQVYGQCSLVCKTNRIDTSFVAHCGDVIDGTWCATRPENNDAVDGICLESKCLKIGCDKKIHSVKRFDDCGVCDGDNSSCRVIADQVRVQLREGQLREGQLREGQLREGLHTVITIPSRARNIHVSKVPESGVQLVLQDSRGKLHVKRQRNIKLASFRIKTEGTIFRYDHAAHGEGGREVLVSPGPTEQETKIMVLSETTRGSTSVNYSYTLTRRRRPLRFFSPLKAQPAPRGLGEAAVEEADTSRRMETGEAGSSPATKAEEEPMWWTTQEANTNIQEERTMTDRPQNGTTMEVPASPTVESATEFTLADTTPRSDYDWVTDRSAPCSTTCVSGAATSHVQCQRLEDGSVVADALCDGLTKPPLVVTVCDGRPCRPRWETTRWSECSVACGVGNQTRSVRCWRMIAPGFDSTVSRVLCQGQTIPANSRPCYKTECGPQWEVSSWGECFSQCGSGVKKRRVLCSSSGCDAATRPAETQPCDTGPCANSWGVDEWSSCSGRCGDGLMQRSVSCHDANGLYLHDKHCDPLTRPLSINTCTTLPEETCAPVWIPQSWGVCSQECGEGNSTRSVVCGAVENGDFRVVEEHLCSHIEEPNTRGSCREQACKPEWFYSPWSKCSASCGSEGVRIRRVTCYHKDLVSIKCTLDIKPSNIERCVLPSCDAFGITPTHGGECADDAETNCVLVAESGLCVHEEYMVLCCETCYAITSTVVSETTIVTETPITTQEDPSLMQQDAADNEVWQP